MVFAIALLGQVPVASASSDVIFSFGLMTDIHYNDIPELPERPRYFRTSLINAGKAVEIFNAEGVDFIVSLGDSIDGVTRAQDQIDLARLDEVFTGFEGDLHYVIGNHDLRNLTREEYLYITSGVGESANYYFDMEGFRFIVIDANWAPNYTIHSAVVAWLEETIIEAALVDAEEKGLKAVVFVHQWLYNPNISRQIQNAEQVREIFERVGNVFAVFQGHVHRGGSWYINGIYYWGVQAMVNYQDPTFVILRVYEDGIDIEGYGGATSGWLPYIH